MSEQKDEMDNIIVLPSEEYYSRNNYQIMKISSRNFNHVEVIRKKKLNEFNSSFTTKDEDEETKSYISYDYEEISYLDLNE